MSLEAYIIVLAPEFVLLVGACVVLLAGVAKGAPRSNAVSGAALVVVLLALGVSFWGGSPDGSLVLPGLWLTSLTYYVRVVALSVGALLVLVNWHQPVAQERGEYLGMILFSLLGVLLTASANDLLVLFFAVELVSVPTYVLIALSRPVHRALESAVKYFFLGALAAAVLAYGMSFLYGVAGSTALTHLSDGVMVPSFAPGVGGLSTYAVIGLLLVFAGLAFKVAAVPFHVYAPDVYEGAAAPVTGLLGFVPKLAGFVALIKVFGAFAWDLPTSVLWLIWVVAAVTMTAGNVLALLQHNVKRLLGYSSIAHTGYMLIALLVGPVAGQGPLRDGVAALLFYVAIYGVMNLGAFALIGAFRAQEQEAETLEELAGLAKQAPAAALGLAVCVFSLMGFPPTAGLLGKVFIFSSAFSVGALHPFHGPLIALAVIGVLNSAVAAAYYLRIVATVYMGASPRRCVPAGGAPIRWGLTLCSLILLVFFCWPAGLAREAKLATASLHEPAAPTALTAAQPATASHLRPVVVADGGSKD